MEILSGTGYKVKRKKGLGIIASRFRLLAMIRAKSSQGFMLRPLLRRWSENPGCGWSRVTRVSSGKLQFVYWWDSGEIKYLSL